MAGSDPAHSVASMTSAHRAGFLTGAALLACAAPSAAAEPVNGRIAFSTFESGAGATGDIWTMNPDGGGREQAVFDPLDDAQSDWSSDGTRIVYRSRRNNQFEISIIDLGVVTRTARSPPAAACDAADGRELAAQSGARTAPPGPADEARVEPMRAQRERVTAPTHGRCTAVRHRLPLTVTYPGPAVEIVVPTLGVKTPPCRQPTASGAQSNSGKASASPKSVGVHTLAVVMVAHTRASARRSTRPPESP